MEASGAQDTGVRLQTRAVVLKVKPLNASSFLGSWKLARIAESLAPCQSSSIEFCLLNQISTGFPCRLQFGSLGSQREVLSLC